MNFFLNNFKNKGRFVMQKITLVNNHQLPTNTCFRYCKTPASFSKVM